MRNLKRFMALLFAIALITLIALPAAYAADGPPDSTIPTEYTSWEFIGTFSGAVIFTGVIVQFLKLPIDKVWKIPTKYIVYAIALGLLICVEAVTQGGITAGRIPLIILNAILVSLAAMKAYESTVGATARDKPPG